MNVDYDIHGVLGLRLIDPTPSLARLVAASSIPGAQDPWRPSPMSRLHVSRPFPLAEAITASGMRATVKNVNLAIPNSFCARGPWP